MMITKNSLENNLINVICSESAGDFGFISESVRKITSIPIKHVCS